MTNKLTLTLSKSVVDKMGTVEGCEELREILLEIMRKSSNEKFDCLSFVESIDRLENIFFIPIVIKNMIITNKTFYEALSLSKEEINDKVSRVKFEFGILDENEKEKVSAILSSFNEFVDEEKAEKNFNFALENLSYEFFKALEIYNVIAITNKIIPIVHDEIKREVADPFYEVFEENFETIIKYKLKDNEEDLDDNIVKMLKLTVESELESNIKEMYSSIPLQILLSKVIEKAINENLTFMKSLLSFNFNELVEEVIFEINNSPDYDRKKLKSQMSEVLKKIFELF